MSTTNPEGLTWPEWYAAATFGVPSGRRPVEGDPRWRELREAWRKGEDPTDHAAALAQGAD